MIFFDGEEFQPSERDQLTRLVDCTSSCRTCLFGITTLSLSSISRRIWIDLYAPILDRSLATASRSIHVKILTLSIWFSLRISSLICATFITVYSPPKSPNIVQRTSVAPILFSMGYHCFCVEHGKVGRTKWMHNPFGIGPRAGCDSLVLRSHPAFERWIIFFCQFVG